MHLILAATMLVCAQTEGATPRMLTAAEFGAVGDGVTDDGPALRRALAAAAEASRASDGPVALRLEPGVKYRIGPWDERWCTLPLQRARNLVVDGQGAELLVHPKNQTFILEACENVVIRGLKIDYAPLPFTQGDILSVDYEAHSFVLRLHEGYAAPPSTAWVRENGQTFDHGVFIEAAPSNLFTHRWIYVDSVEPVPGRDRTYTIASGPGTLDQIAPGMVEAGQRFAFYVPHTSREETEARNGHNERGWYSRLTASIQVYDSENCRFEDIDLYTSPRMGVYMDGCAGLVFRRFNVVRRPGTNRLISTASDGIHGRCRRGPLIEDCAFEGAMDDSLGIGYMAHVVAEQLSDRRLRVEYTNIVWHDTRIREGDTLQAWDPVQGRVLGEGRIEQLDFLSSHVRVVELDKPLSGVRDWVNDLGGVPEKRNQATQLFLKIEEPAMVRGCRFATQLKEAVRITYSAVVEDNQIEDTAYGINCINDPVWWSGPHAQNLVYRNNDISGAWPFSIGAQVYAQQPGMTPVHGGVVIEENRILLRPRPWGSIVETGILVRNLRGVRIRNNTITMDPRLAPSVPAIHAVNCPDALIEDNEVIDQRPEPGGKVVITE